MNSIAYRVGGYAQYVESPVANTVRAAGGDLGGGSETLVVTAGTPYVGALCARDWKGIGSQYVSEGKVICFERL